MSLARAVYANAEVILMDDPISALDAKVKKAVFLQVFRGMCKNQTRVLVTHAVDFLHLCDRIVVMKNGKISAIGTYEELAADEHVSGIVKIHRDQIQDQNESIT